MRGLVFGLVAVLAICCVGVATAHASSTDYAYPGPPGYETYWVYYAPSDSDQLNWMNAETRAQYVRPDGTNFVQLSWDPTVTGAPAGPFPGTPDVVGYLPIDPSNYDPTAQPMIAGPPPTTPYSPPATTTTTTTTTDQTTPCTQAADCPPSVSGSGTGSSTGDPTAPVDNLQASTSADASSLWDQLSVPVYALMAAVLVSFLAIKLVRRLNG